MPSQVKAEWREAELARLQKITDQAFLERLQGNQAMKDGDDTTALRMFHGVLLQLKGLDGAFAQLSSHRQLARSSAQSKAEGEDDHKSESTSKTPDRELHNAVVQAMKLTYINSAAIHIRRSNYKRAQECAQSALKFEEKNPKARFRLAQAKVGLGQVSTGKTMLEELYRETHDVAIANALRQLELDEKTSETKSREAMRGMFTTKPAASGATAKQSDPKPPTSHANESAVGPNPATSF